MKQRSDAGFYVDYSIRTRPSPKGDRVPLAPVLLGHEDLHPLMEACAALIERMGCSIVHSTVQPAAITWRAVTPTHEVAERSIAGLHLLLRRRLIGPIDYELEVALSAPSATPRDPAAGAS